MRQLSSITLNQQPLLLSPGTSVKEACRRMHETQLGSVLVIKDGGHILGIFTGRDVVQRVIAQDRDVSETAIESVMTPEPEVMAPEDSAIDALRLMWDGGFRHVPVAKGGKVLGIVTRSDFSETEELQLRDERELWEHMR